MGNVCPEKGNNERTIDLEEADIDGQKTVKKKKNLLKTMGTGNPSFVPSSGHFTAKRIRTTGTEWNT
jgi:hypothetical protein